jgi:acetyltransferase-like isoleucine patch superfamily enzyme
VLRAVAALLIARLPAAGLRRNLFALLGWSVDPSAAIGVSWIDCAELTLGVGASVGHGCRLGPLASVTLASRASIGHSCRVAGTATGAGSLELAEGASIVGSHFVDAGAGVVLGRFATLAGRGSQVWTHGWKAFGEGDDPRTQAAAPVSLGDDAYVGAGAILLPGVELAERVTVGAGAVVGRGAARRCEPGGTLVGNPAAPPG